MKCAKDSCYKNKDALLNSASVRKNTVSPDSLSKQKDQPALASLSTELSQALQMDHVEQAKEVCLFLEALIKHVLQYLTATDPSK